jgi:hypothetical protein
LFPRGFPESLKALVFLKSGRLPNLRRRLSLSSDAVKGSPEVTRSDPVSSKRGDPLAARRLSSPGTGQDPVSHSFGLSAPVSPPRLRVVPSVTSLFVQAVVTSVVPAVTE